MVPPNADVLSFLQYKDNIMSSHMQINFLFVNTILLLYICHIIKVDMAQIRFTTMKGFEEFPHIEVLIKNHYKGGAEEWFDWFGPGIHIDDYELNHYKVESQFKTAKFIRQKCYIEIGYNDEINSTIAGMPKKLGKYVNLDNFNPGFSIKADDSDYEDKKLTFQHVKGGVILVPVDFTIKS